MANEAMLKELNDNYQNALGSFAKSDFSYVTGKDSARGRMLGMFTIEYWKREDLWKTGTIVWGYAYRNLMTDLHNPERAYSSWVLFSPSREFAENPQLYTEVLARLTALEKEKARNRKLHELKLALFAELSEPKFLEIPEPYAGGHLVYCSMVYVRYEHIYDFRLGFLPVIISPSVSKEVMYLPERYWTEAFRNEYYHNEAAAKK